MNIEKIWEKKYPATYRKYGDNVIIEITNPYMLYIRNISRSIWEYCLYCTHEIKKGLNNELK